MKPYSIIIGSDHGDLAFMGEHIVAHAVTFDGRSLYCTEHPNPQIQELQYLDKLDNQLRPLPEGAFLRARRWPIDFDAMDDNEIDARYHAMRLTQDSMGKTEYRILRVDMKCRRIAWKVTDRGSAPILKETYLSDPERNLVSTTDFAEVDKLCHAWRVSVNCNLDLGQRIMWTATSAHMNGLTMHSENRSRSVIQLLLLSFYQRRVDMYLDPETIRWALASNNKLTIGA